MKLVYTAPNMPLVAHVRNLLEARGVRCQLRNQFLAGAAGELPPIQCWPELWVSDFQAEFARELVADSVGDPRTPAPSDWQCPACGEWVAGNFAVCWNCDAPVDA